MVQGFVMSLKSYLPHGPSLVSAVDLSVVDMETDLGYMQEAINSHPFNQQVAVLLPHCSLETAQAHLGNSLGCFYTVEMKLSCVLDPVFLKTYFQSNTHCLVLHSSEAHLDSDDVVAVDSRGHLILSLTKTTYELLGMPARKQTRSDAQRQRYLIQIHLADQALVPGTKRYERMVFCLDKAFGRPMKMVAASVDKVTGSPQEIEWPKGSLWQQHENRGVVEELSDITIPSFDTLQPMMIQAAAWEQSAMSAVEWIGLAHHKAKRLNSTDRPDPFLSVYRPPTPHTTHQKSVIISWKGLILPSLIHSTLLVLRKMMSVKATESWTSLTVWGCQDSPFGWDQQEHHYFLGGENDSTILLLPDSEQGQSSMALYYKMYGSHHVSY